MFNRRPKKVLSRHVAKEICFRRQVNFSKIEVSEIDIIEILEPVIDVPNGSYRNVFKTVSTQREVDVPTWAAMRRPN